MPCAELAALPRDIQLAMFVPRLAIVWGYEGQFSSRDVLLRSSKIAELCFTGYHADRLALPKFSGKQTRFASRASS